MWLFPLLLFLPTLGLAADCFSAQITAGGVYNCDDLVVDAPINLTGAGGPVVEINVSGTTQINASITLDGASGVTVTAVTAPGAAAGPGGWDGGGISLGTTEDGGGPLNVSTANGKTTTDDLTCGNGGGGAGFTQAGANGRICPTTTDPTAIGIGGTVVPNTDFDFGAAFRGGFGGGAGAYSTPLEIGTGGGGGGALRINSTGNVLIRQNVRISARGGNGGNAAGVGGAGGAGSGGAIWIQSAGKITNYGILDVRGGTGGTNSSSGASGGNAGAGVFRLQDGAGLLVSGSGVRDFNLPASLDSDISCGTVAPREEKSDHPLTFTLGFALSLILAASLRILFRAPGKA